MTTASVSRRVALPDGSRRAPVQERSRQTVTRILDAASAIADEQGVDAVCSRDRIDIVESTLGLDLCDHERAGVGDFHLRLGVAGRIVVMGEAERGAAPATRRIVGGLGDRAGAETNPSPRPEQDAGSAALQ